MTNQLSIPIFIPVGNCSRKVECIFCGARGYDVSERRPSWKAAHLRGHAPCPDCGKMLSLKINGLPRRHGRCPTIPITLKGTTP